MKSIVDAIIGILMLLVAGTLAHSFYHAVKRETVIKIHHGLSPLSGFTKRLTGNKMKY